MRRVSMICAVAFATVVVPACADSNESVLWHRSRPVTAGENGDVCAPGNEVAAEDTPTAPCALRTEHHVPDLTRPAQPGAATTQSLHVLDAPVVAADKPSCTGRAGAGYTSCGADGTDSCCRAATVPPGSAGALTRITSAFDLGVYEVTAARFATFVDATAGNLRGAAAGLAGFAAAHAQYLPTTRGEVDDALGPACKFRGDPRNFGARTWWSQDVEDAVAGIMTDQNDRAADIRADATKERLAAKPSNCVSYYMAEAFCAWDGGRLPTSEEWIYAALGGEELREYPWGSGRTHERLVTDLNRSQNGGPADAQFTFPEDFPYFDNGMNAYHIAPPGRKPAGASRWGQQDMAGNVLEWMADILGPDAGIVRGGSWEGHADANAVAYTNYPLDRTYGSVGFRCAYGPRQAGDGPAAPDANAMLVPLHLSLNEANADWLLTRTESEGEPVFHHRGIQMRVLGAAPAGADVAPLYRCITPGGRHLASNQPDCEGLGTSEGMLGYTYKNAVANALPVYRCSTVLGNHVSTLYAAECNFPGMKIDGTQGFAFPR